MLSEYQITVAMFLANAAGMLLVAGAIYGAIRADLKHIHEKIAMLDSAHKERIEAVEISIHRRIDDMKKENGVDHA
ncbi:MAG: hypothetical protein ABL993_00945 [Vicinamibacterales bacterium]